MEPTAVRVTSNGQVSLPAPLRRRWSTSQVLVVDCGNYAIVRPIPADPWEALQGAHAGEGPPSEEARAADRHDEERRSRRRGDSGRS